MGGQALGSPEIASDHRVTFRLRAPQANEVSVSGLPASLPMVKDAQGVWSVTTESALAPDIYSYSFVVNGVRIPDPSNMMNSSVGIMGTNSLLRIPGVVWTDSDGPHGAVAKHVYQSAIIGGSETYYVYTPPNYDAKRKAPYPVLVVLHGLGAGNAASAADWILQGCADVTLDNLINSGKAVPMILISPAANGNTQGTMSAAAGFPNFTNALINEILPQVEKQYNATSQASERAITGLSAGAAQSLLLLNRLDKFAWIGSFSPGFDMYSPNWGRGRGAGANTQQPGRGAQPAQAAGSGGALAGGQQTGRGAPPAQGAGGRGTITQRALLEDGALETIFPKLDASSNGRIKLLYFTCGTADDHLNLTRQFKAFLEARKVKISSYSEPEGAQHNWVFWRPQLAAFAAMLFK
jgi:enterochelin esterase family protein